MRLGDQSVMKATGKPGAGEERPSVEVIDGPLCSAAELQRAVTASAITSGIVCAIAGIGVGYLLGLRDGGK